MQHSHERRVTQIPQVGIHIPDELIDEFSEFCPLFIVDSIPDEIIPSHIKEYQARTG